MPASNLWAARQKAAAEGKLLFLWYMAGEPLVHMDRQEVHDRYFAAEKK